MNEICGNVKLAWRTVTMELLVNCEVIIIRLLVCPLVDQGGCNPAILPICLICKWDLAPPGNKEFNMEWWQWCKQHQILNIKTAAYKTKTKT